MWPSHFSRPDCSVHFWIAGSPWGAQEGADSSSPFPLVRVESRQSVVVRSTVPQEAAHHEGPTGLRDRRVLTVYSMLPIQQERAVQENGKYISS